jgi:hypothetical protein
MRAWILCLVLMACERERPPPPPPYDAGPRPDAGRFDGGPIVRRDAGPIGPAIDGTDTGDEWEDATVVEADVETDHEGSTLTRLLAQIAGGRLFVGIEGSLAEGDSLVLYVDRALGVGEGVAPSELADTDGALDVALANDDLIVPEGFAMDFAWGTTLVPRTAVGEDAAIGWRDLEDPEVFVAIDGAEAPAVCSETFCETSIALDTLGGDTPRTIALFARIVSSDGLTNQTLPEDDALAPAQVTALLTIEEGDLPDAGVPDAGADAGSPGIVIDGVVDAAEWSGATVFSSSTVATGGFSGNALRALRVVRDDTTLYVAITATLTSGNAILMYVDHDLGGPDGAAVALDDFSGALDRALTKTFAASELRLDAAWGTLDMPSLGTAADRVGWRNVGNDPSLFTALPGPTVCSSSACETGITLSALGATAIDTIGLFVRLGSATIDFLSNQTLPMDTSSETVTVYVEVPP